jgi:hypothetical protein
MLERCFVSFPISFERLLSLWPFMMVAFLGYELKKSNYSCALFGRKPLKRPKCVWCAADLGFLFTM